MSNVFALDDAAASEREKIAIAAIGKRGCDELKRIKDSALGGCISKYAAFTGDAPITPGNERLPEIFAGADLAFIICDENGASEESFLDAAQAAKKSGALTAALLISGGDFEKNSPSTLKQAGDATFFISTRNEEGFSAFNVIEIIADLIFRPGLVNIDLDDIKSTLKNSGKATAGIGTSKAPEDLAAAGQRALDMAGGVAGMKNILFGITGGSKVNISEITKFAHILSQNRPENANIIWGQIYDPDMEDEYKVVIIAAGCAEA